MTDAVRKRLDKTYERADIRALDIADARLIIFSDQHKGGQDAADDFASCEVAYTSALEHYLQAGYRLVVLGDGEEIWERRPATVVRNYQHILELESRFQAAGGHWRFVGNHDDQWYFQSEVDRYLAPIFGPLTLWDGLRVTVTAGGETLGELFFVHGHQGTFWSDYLRGISRLVVRYLWRPFQRLTGIKSSTPSQDWRLRSKHDTAMYNWAVTRERLILIAGHTHQTVFIPGDVSNPQQVETEAQSGEVAQAAQAYAAYLEQTEQPCYFNGGCCSYADGTITGIEISDGQIRLVRWLPAGGWEELAAADLRAVFAAVAQPGEVIAAPAG